MVKPLKENLEKALAKQKKTKPATAKAKTSVKVSVQPDAGPQPELPLKKGILTKLEEGLVPPLKTPQSPEPDPAAEPPQFDAEPQPAKVEPPAPPAPAPVKPKPKGKLEAPSAPQPPKGSVKHGIEKYWWILLLVGLASAGIVLWRLRSDGPGPSKPDYAGDTPAPQQPQRSDSDQQPPKPRADHGGSAADQIVRDWFSDDPRFGGSA